MHGKPISSIAAELNNVLTVVAMCADELERVGPNREAFADIRDAVRRGAALTRELGVAAGVPASLAAVAAPVAAESAPAASQVVLAAGTVVLVVDPEEGVRRSVARALEEHRWHVLEARSVSEAMKRLEEIERR